MVKIPKYRMLLATERLEDLGLIPKVVTVFPYKAIYLDEDGLKMDTWWSNPVEAKQCGVSTLYMTRAEALEIKALYKLSGSLFHAIHARIPERLERVIVNNREYSERTKHVI